MNWLLPAPIYLPLLGAGLTLAVHRRVALQRILAAAIVAVSTIASIVLLITVESDGVQVVQAGGWPAPIGITLVADLFSAIVLVVALLTILAVLLFAIGQLSRLMEARYFHPIYLVLAAGVSASLLTGDLFNLFVAFEVTLISSYTLLTLGGGRHQIRPALTYVVTNLFASTMFITGLALIYAAAGTVNMADLAGKVPTLPPHLQQALAMLFLVVFGVKAAIFPLFFWLPDSYPTAPVSVTAVFAGLLTKVGIYALIRTQTIVFGEGLPRTLLLTIAAATMIVGVLGALAQDDMKRIFSFHIVSQIGYMVLGLGLVTVGGLAATIFMVPIHIPVMTALFLAAGVIERGTGTGALHRLGGLAHRMPVAAVLFALPAMSLAGIPPFSGFFGKLALIQAGLEARAYLAIGIGLAVGLLTLFSMAKVWAGVFWGVPDEEPPRPEARGEGRIGAPAMMSWATGALIALTLALAFGAEWVFDLSSRAAQDLVDPSPYIAAVLGR